MVTYIKNNIAGKFIELAEPLDEGLYNIGHTLEDYRRGAWVALSEEQADFRAGNPGASVSEVWNMEIEHTEEETPERTLRQAISEKLSEIERYDKSDAVNSFSINGVSMWYDKATRVGLANSIGAEESDGRTETTLWHDGVSLTLPIQQAKDILKAVELYAIECFNVTSRHGVAVGRLTEIEDVDSYDYRTAYPERLDFNIESV